jgi:hypothetical protein
LCGLLGLHTKRKHGLFKQDIDEFKQMMYLTAFRGRDSTGIAGIDLDSNNEASLIKAVDAPHYLFGFTQSDDFFDRAIKSYTTLIGHTRYATRGLVNATNAHPYKEGHIILAHNGVINNYEALRDKDKHADISVDSHLIAKLFQENNPKDVLGQIEGAYVFMWFDEVERTFNMARNYLRPMFIGNNLDSTLLFASEKETLEWNAVRNKTALKSIEAMETHKILTWYEGSIEPVEEEYKPYTKVYNIQSPSVGYRGHSNNYDDGAYDHWDSPVKGNPKKEEKGNIVSNTIRDLMTPKPTPRPNLVTGDEVVFSIVDYDGYEAMITVVGESKRFPNTIFRATYNHRINTELFKTREWLRGYVRNVAKAAPNSEYEWAVYCTPLALLEHEHQHSPDVGEHNTISINDIDGEKRTLTTKLFHTLLKGTCAWCAKNHPIDSHTKPDKVMYTKHSDKLVCYHCTPLRQKALENKQGSLLIVDKPSQVH